MNKRIQKTALAIGLLVLSAVGAIADAGDGAAIRRYALLVGANNGGPGREPLLFAVSDTQTFAAVMYELGGLDRTDSLVAVNPTKSELKRDVARMRELVDENRGTSTRSEFLLYYSGHSDENGLLLNGELFSYRELRDAMTAVGADVSMAILDSCASGAFIRLKGGQRVSPFLMDESSQMTGQVYLTSSSENEASQESDAIGGSFFTHALVTGLRGGADYSLDGKVTLHEAYQFAQQETLASTENTLAGPQHPSWQIDLTGTGDLVLTDLRVVAAGINIASEVSGRISVRDSQQKLVAELRKAAGNPVALALPPGRYTINTSSGLSYLEATVSLKAGSWIEIAASDFRPGALVSNRTRGDAAEIGSEVTATSPGPYDDIGREPLSAGEFGSELSNLVGRFVSGVLSSNNLPRRINGKIFGSGASGSSTASDGAMTTAPAPSTYDSDAFGAAEATAASEPAYTSISPISIQFVPGIGYPWIGERSLKMLSFNLLVGLSYDVIGADFGSVINIVTRNMYGAEFAGVGNIVGHEVRGAQFAGVFNIVSGDAGWLQSAGVLNVADGRMTGIQSAGVINVAGELSGAQISVVNVGRTMSGAQVGVVNVATRANGLQVGVVNVARSGSVFAIGLVNVVPGGFVSFDFSRDQTGFYDFALASGRSLYTVFGIGTDAVERGGLSSASASSMPIHLASQAGIGARLPFGPFYASLDATSRFVQTVEVSSAGASPVTPSLPFARLHGQLGLTLFNTIGVFAGYSADILYPGVGSAAREVQSGIVPRYVTVSGAQFEVFPKYELGVSLKF